MSTYISALENRESNLVLYYSNENDLWKYITVILKEKLNRGLSVCIHATGDTYSWIEQNILSLSRVSEKQYNSLTQAGIDDVINTGRLLSTRCLGKWSTVDIIDLLTQYRQDIEPYPFNAVTSFNYSAEELYDLIKAIDKFKAYKQFYQEEGLRARDISKYRKEVIFNLGDEEFKKKIKAWISECKEIIFRFHTGLNEEKDAYKQEALVKLNHDIQSFENKLDQLDILFSTYGEDVTLKPNLLSFDQKKKEGYKKWQELISTMNITADQIGYEELVMNLKQKIQNARSSYVQEKKQIQLLQKGINELNTENTNLLYSSEQLNRLIQNINESSIYQRSFECNTHSIEQKIKITLDIKEELELSLQHSNIKAAIEWSEIRDTLAPEFITFLSQLQQLPQGHWRVQFEYFYLDSFLKENNIELFNTSTEQMINYNLTSQILYQTCLDELNQWILNNPSLISLTDKAENKEGSYDIYIDTDLPDQSDGLHIIYKEETGPAHIFSMIDELTSIESIQPSQQLNRVKKLAYNLYPFLINGIGYQTKESNIISALDHHWEAELDKRIKDLGGKPFILENADDLINFMLSVQRSTCLIVQDYLVDVNAYDNLFQYEAIDYLKQSGIEIINLSSLEILQDETSALNKVLNQLPLKHTTEVNLSRTHGIEH